MLALLAAVTLLRGRVVHQPSGQGARGLGGVLVSNGRDVAATAPDGGFSLPAHGRFVFVITPGGWINADFGLPAQPSGLPRFPAPLPFRAVEAGAPSQRPFLFRLRPVQSPREFDALVLTDTQPANLREVGYLERSLTAPLGRGAAERFAFGLTLGDVTYDRPDLYPAIDAALEQLHLPMFLVNGNHDLSLGIAGEHAVDAFEAAYGPSTYAFHWGPALFIALNDVRHEGGPRYHGGLLPDQRQFLEGLLGPAPAETPIILFCHIPLFPDDPFAAAAFPDKDRLALFALLRPFRTVLILSGHTHTQRRFFHTASDGWNGAAPLLEDNVAAACGGYWGGPLDAAGVPVSTMSDGTPPGYAILHVTPTSLATTYHRRPDLGPDDVPEARLSLHVPRVVAPGQGYVTFYVNDYDGAPGTVVRARVDDGGWVPLRPAYVWDPNYAAAYLAQDTAPLPSRTPRLPEPSLCFHLWRGFLPAGLTVGSHHLQVLAGADASSAPFEVSLPLR